MTILRDACTTNIAYDATGSIIDSSWVTLKIVVSLLAENTKGGSTTVPLTSCLTGLDWSVLQIKTKIVSCHTANSKPVKQEVNSTVIIPPLVFPAFRIVKMIVTVYSTGHRSQTHKTFLYKLPRCFWDLNLYTSQRNIAHLGKIV